MDGLKNCNAWELTLKHARIRQEREQLPPGAEISPAKKEEMCAIEEELRRRLYKNLGGDALPTITTGPGGPSQGEDKPKISFRFEVISSLKTKIDTFKIEAITKEAAWIEAEERAKKYPGKVSLKSS